MSVDDMCTVRGRLPVLVHYYNCIPQPVRHIAFPQHGVFLPYINIQGITRNVGYRRHIHRCRCYRLYTK